MCREAKNLHNTTNFYIRQVFTALRQDEPLQPLQQQIMDTLQANIGLMNERQLEAHQKRLRKQLLKPADQRKDSHCRLFELPTKESPYVDYAFLDCLFKVMEQADYRALPAQCSQWVLKGVLANWSSFFSSMKDYRAHPDKYAGRPHIPGYTRVKAKEVMLTNQDCEIKDRKYLKLPMTKQRLNIGKLGCTDGTLKQVRIIPKYGQYVMELVFSVCQAEVADVIKENVLAIDLGIEVILTEEAYTSKASFLDGDPMPKYEEGVTRPFSGRRIHRGLYRSRNGLIHADVNAAANIIRKVFPKASADRIAGLDGNQSVNVSTPLMLSIL